MRRTIRLNAPVVCAILACAPLLLVAPVRAAVIRVRTGGEDLNNGGSWPAAKRTVTAALVAARAGDEIWVALGTYHERLAMKNGVALYGGFAGNEANRNARNWLTRVTILDGDQGGVVVDCGIPLGGNDTRIDGFTIRNGLAQMGGGISCVGNAPTIANNFITGNVSIGEGGGICCYNGSDPIIVGNVIMDNYASTSGDGGGICCMAGDAQETTGSSPLIQGNIIARNRANEHGGGIASKGRGSRPTILGNLITENISSESDQGIGGGGIAMVWDGSLTLVANNVISANTGLQAGGILIVGGDLDLPIIVNNTIVGNNSAGLRFNSGCASVVIANNVIAQNGAGITRWNQSGSSHLFALEFNDVYGNGIDYDGLPNLAGLSGNFSANPRLASAAYGNLHLQPDSPCINAGNPFRVGAGWTDMDGQNRVLGGRVDIGADESDGTVWAVNPPIVRVSPAGNDNNNGATWATAKRTVAAAINAIHLNAIGTYYNLNGGEVHVRHGDYQENDVLLPPFVYLYGGYNEADVRNPALTPSVLDGGMAGRVLLAVSGHRLSTVDGFTIANGRIVAQTSDQGAGIECYLSGVTIQNNVLRGNVANLGGAIGGYGAMPLIVNNVITNNSAGSDGKGWGGGLHFDRSAPTILNNTISFNKASDGGGIYVSKSRPQIVGNTIGMNTGNGIFGTNSRDCDWLSSIDTLIGRNGIYGNVTSDQGGGINVLLCSGQIVNNLIVANLAGTAQGGGYGGGLAVNGGDPNDANLIVANNDILYNDAIYFGSYYGGGIFVRLLSKQNVILANNIVAYNSHSGIWNDRTSPVSPKMVHNLFWSNAGINYQLQDVYGVITGGPLSHPTDISGDPLFVNKQINAVRTSGAPGGDNQPWTTGTPDFHLSSDASPCLNAAEPLYAPGGDGDEVPRPLMGKVGAQALPDIGVYEYVSSTADTDDDGLTDGDEVHTHHSNPVLPDSDGDGMPDGAEIKAGTDLTNATSRLVIAALAVPKNGSDGVTVSWLSATNRAYDLLRATSMMGGFTPRFTNLAATPPLNVYTDTTANSSGPFYYRIRLR